MQRTNRVWSRAFGGPAALTLLAGTAFGQVFSHDGGTVGLPGSAVFAGPDVSAIFVGNQVGSNSLVSGSAALGLVAGDNVDGIDAGSRTLGDGQFNPSYLFSVFPGAIGQPGTDINANIPTNAA
ncbi:MAG: hypothetical protein H6809_06855, partial [Phycisphaeraceae bacterium]|nr:hypothetical protein [Phycisphaeraceae bacterium]